MPTHKVIAGSVVVILRFVLGLAGVDALDDNPDTVNAITAAVAFGLMWLVPERNPSKSARGTLGVG